MIKLFKYKAMLYNCLNRQKSTKSIDPNVSATNNGRTMILSKCAICGSKNLNLLKHNKQKVYYIV